MACCRGVSCAGNLPRVALGFTEVCDRWLNPMQPAMAQGKRQYRSRDVDIHANDKIVYNPEMAARFISTLSLKLGVERGSIKLGKAIAKTSCGGSASKCYVLPVTLKNLLCTDEVDETESVAQLLHRVSSCEQNVVTAESASKEVTSLEGKPFYFHTHVTNDGMTHVITARMSGLSKDCKALGGAKTHLQG